MVYINSDVIFVIDNEQQVGIIVGGVVGGVVFLLVVWMSVLCVCVVRRKKRNSRAGNVTIPPPSYSMTTESNVYESKTQN